MADPNFSSINYFESINAIEDKFKDKLQIFPELKTKLTSVQDFIAFVNRAKSDYAKYKIKTNENELNEYLIALEIPKLSEIDFLPYLKNEYSLSPFIQKLEKLIKSNEFTYDIKMWSALLRRYKEVCKDKPLKLKVNDSTIHNLFINSNMNEDSYYDLIAMRIAKLNKYHTAYMKPFAYILKSRESSLISNIADRLEYYINYDEILLGLKTFSKNQLYKEVALKLTTQPVGDSNADVTKLVSNFQEICELGEIEPSTLLNRLDNWESDFIEEITKDNIKQIVSPFFLEQSINSNLAICTHSIETMNEYLNSLTADRWKEVLKDLSSYEIQVSLITNYTFSTIARDALNDVLKDIAVGAVPIPERVKMEKLIYKFEEQNRSLKGIFNSIRDSFCREDCMSVILFKFFGDWLLEYADLEGNQASLRTIFKSDVVRDKVCREIILNHQEKMPAIIRSAQDEAQDFKDIIKDILRIDESENFVSFAKSIGIEIENNENGITESDSK